MESTADTSSGSSISLRQRIADVPASLVTFLVAVPLSMGIALASGAPIVSGLIAAAIGGIVVGMFGGAPLQVSGPAAGLTVIVFDLIHRFGFAAVCGITVAAGLVQVLFGSLRVARLALAISPAVIHGMLAGIGVLITLAQLHVVLGGRPQSSALHNVAELPRQVMSLHGASALLGLFTIAVLLLWPLVPWRRLRAIPGPLLAVATATGLSVLLGLEVARVKLPEAGLLGGLQPPAFPFHTLVSAVGAVLTMALMASAESLLSAVATDKLHSGPRANLDRELIGQGLGNFISGLLGGLPITGVIVRSTANIEAGARTRLSAILHGVWVVLFVSLLGATMQKVPLAVLAGLLVTVGARLVNFAHIRELIKHGEGVVYFATLAGVICTNLLGGIAIGIGVAVMRLLVHLTRLRIRSEKQEGSWRVTVDGALTFLGMPRLNTALSALPAGSRIVVELYSDVVDHAAFDALHSFRTSYERCGGLVDIKQMKKRAQPTSAMTAIPAQLKDTAASSMSVSHPQLSQTV
jgi:carbonic anhydrase